MKTLVSALFLLMFTSSAVLAQTYTPQGVAPLDTLAKHAYVIEADTNTVLYAKDADAQMPTSSMSKVMTMYVVFNAIKKNKISLDTLQTVSETAWKQPGSRMFINPGDKVKVEDLTRGVIVQSGNDAAVALAEAVAGTEASFADLMNDTARELGMNNTHFKNATGLPDPEHYSSAHDLAILALALIRDFPEYYHYYSEKEFIYNNIKQGNRNPLLYRNMGVDGMKTGHTEDAGFGLIAAALREGRRVISVANGMSSMQERADESAKLIEWAYREFGTYDLVKSDQVAGEAKVWLGEKKTVSVVPAKSVRMTLPRGAKESLKVEATIVSETEAPIKKGQVIGKLIAKGNGFDTVEVPLVAAEDVKRLGFFAASIAKIKRMMGKE